MPEMPKSESNSARQDGVAQSVIDALPVTVEAVLGVAKVTVGDLARMNSGDSFTLDSRLGDPVELRVNGTVVACGELVSVGDNFGVRIQTIARE